MINFRGREYFDDRLFVLYLCKAESKIDLEGFVNTTIFHEDSPVNSLWCILTYENCNQYPLYSTKLFDSKNEAKNYIRQIEPETPLISLSGKSPNSPMSYKDYLFWKEKNNFKEFDYRAVYSPGGSNHREQILQTFEMFLKSNPEKGRELQKGSIPHRKIDLG